MAKELPYFKFFVSEWNDGDITLEDLETQGLFINLCSYYWSNGCKITLSKSIKKFRFADKKLFDNLINNEIIHVNEDLITINFLDEQKEERERNSLKNRENGKKGGRPKKPKETQDKPTENPMGFDSQSEQESKQKAIREEEKREEKKRREKKRKEDIDFIYSLYPTKCPNRKASTGKTSKNKEKIETLLSTKSKDELQKTIKRYLLECDRDKEFLKNFGTFLNNLPDYSEEDQKQKIDSDYVYFKWTCDAVGIKHRKVHKDKAEYYFENQKKGGYIPEILNYGN